MNVLIINGSPRVKKSNTQYIVDILSGLLVNCTIKNVYVHSMRDFNSVMDDLRTSDTVIFAQPLYIDAIHADALACMEFIEKKCHEEPFSKIIYAICNNGFYEGVQNKIALDMMKCWCDACGFVYGGGIGVGAGEMIVSIKDDYPVDKGPARKMWLCLSLLAKHVCAGSVFDNQYSSPLYFPRFMYRFFAGNQFWKGWGKKNGLKVCDLSRKVRMPEY